MIELEGVGKRWPGSTAPAVADVTLSVPHGTCLALVGPSGCGKTTTLRMINRLVEPDTGRIRINGADALAADPVQLRRGIGYVIQGAGLFPHRTVGANVATVPRLLGWPAARVEARVAETLALVGLDPAEFGPRYPHQLSGGQRQRIGVARALAADPPVLLMDEPFGAVDPVVRDRLQAEVLRLLRELGKTVVVVTHDLAEAVRLGDHIAVMEAGRIAQHATPSELLARPANAFVAGFLGADRALTRLALLPAAALPRRALPAAGPLLPTGASLRDALAAMLERGSPALPTTEGGAITLDDLFAAAAIGAGKGP